MKKEVTAVFSLTPKEIKSALYDYFVVKLKEERINAMFSEESITIEYDGCLADKGLSASLTINEDKEY